MPRAVPCALLAVLGTAGLLTRQAPAHGAGAPAEVSYRPPVQGTVVDVFRPPATPYGPSNLGIDYRTPPGSEVVAPADGTVTFAGQVGLNLFVVVEHGDGVRTTMGYLASVSVIKGQRVVAGQVVGRSAATVHFGARIGDSYLDPAALLADAGLEVFLVKERLPAVAVHDDKWHLGRMAVVVRPTARFLANGAQQGVATFGRAAIDGFTDPSWLILGNPLFGVSVEIVDRVTHLPAFWQGKCTKSGRETPRLNNRRLVVLVGGLDSRIDSGFVHNLDTARLGYADEMVFPFSYRGGYQPYYGEETTQDLNEVGRRLRAYLVELARRHPGVPIDLIAHSQGGIVARVALVGDRKSGEAPAPPVAHLVTMASPHLGAPAADLVDGLSGTPAVVGLVLRDRLLGGADLLGMSLDQLRTDGAFLRELNFRGLPAGLRATSIASRGDLVVPAPNARLGGAVNVVVDLPSVFSDHSALPTSEPGVRELALALNEMPPGCETIGNSVGDFLIGHMVSGFEMAPKAVLP